MFDMELMPELNVITDEVATFAAKLQGELILPGDAAYDEARAVWNGMIDRYPAMIARCESVGDVVTAVIYARDNDLLLSVRGGGHNVAGHATNDGGLVVDLSPMNSVEVNGAVQTVRVGGGATLGELDRATQAHGLIVPVGIVSETGIGGITLGGGFGWLKNKYGLTCDNLIEAEVVTADGRVLIANETENADLFWGLRGGGGNFGVVTHFTFRAYAFGPDVMLLAAFHDGRDMKKVLQVFRDYTATAPDEVSLLAVCGIFPPVDLFPAEVHGRPFALLIGCYIGPIDEGEAHFQYLREFQEPLLDFSGVMPFAEVQQFFDEDYPAGELRYYWKSLSLTHLDDVAIERIVEHVLVQPSVHSTTDIWHNGGAFSRVADESMAFYGRHIPYLINPEANWEHAHEDEENITWVRDFLADMAEFSDGSRYLNFPGFQEEGEAMIQDAFATKYSKLAALKAKYDPTNLFKLNWNIRPSKS